MSKNSGQLRSRKTPRVLSVKTPTKPKNTAAAMNEIEDGARKKITFSAHTALLRASRRCAVREGLKGAGALARRELVKYLLAQGLISEQDAFGPDDDE